MKGQQRTTEQIFKHHLDAFSKKDLKKIASDFSEQSIYINSLGVTLVGVKAIMEIYKSYFQSQEEGTTSAIKTMIIKGDVVFLEWTSDSPSSSINDGVDTFVIREGFIYAQTAKFTVVKKEKTA